MAGSRGERTAITSGSSDPADVDHAVAAALARHHEPLPAALPSKRTVAAFVDQVVGLLFPQLAADADGTPGRLPQRVTRLRSDLGHVLRTVVSPERAEQVAERLTLLLPEIHDRLCADANAILAGDPAAESLDEVIAAYPGFFAITVHRLAHVLYESDVPIVPRLFAEVAHGRTGVDIHPGADVGGACCIDHGTGIVIGETAVIGDDVRVYQGVTLGALSVTGDAAGTKRHPTIEDRVVLYANATVLGGDTTVGHDSVIGGNVWLTTSVPPRSFVYHTSHIRVRSVSDALDPPDYSI